jgi:glycosyltransferase involved in cell wall biosynthesis
MPSILIVVPCFNEAQRLDEAAFTSFATTHSAFRFLFVDDGSTDATLDLLKHLNSQLPAQFRYLALSRNVGKAEAVRAGINRSLDSPEFDYFGFVDADLSADLTQLILLRDAFDADHIRMAMGARVKRLGSQITRHPMRHYLGRGFATFVSVALALDVYDSQCGIKLLDREYATAAFATPFCTKWIFDVEMLVRLRAEHADFESRVVEVPLTSWTEKGGSKISLASYLKVPLDILRIRRKYGLSFGRRIALSTGELGNS